MQTSGDLKSGDSISCTTPQMSTNPYLTHPHCPHRQVHLMGGGGGGKKLWGDYFRGVGLFNLEKTIVSFLP